MLNNTIHTNQLSLPVVGRYLGEPNISVINFDLNDFHLQGFDGSNVQTNKVEAVINLISKRIASIFDEQTKISGGNEILISNILGYDSFYINGNVQIAINCILEAKYKDIYLNILTINGRKDFGFKTLTRQLEISKDYNS